MAIQLFTDKPKQPQSFNNMQGLSPLQSQAFPIEQMQQPSLLVKKESPQTTAFESKVKDEVATLSSRIRLIESSLDNIRDHVNLLDKSIIEKHKSVVSDLRNFEEELRVMRADISDAKELISRISKRLEVFASKQELKILERYIDMIQPMNFVSRAEVDAVVKKILKEQGINIQEEVN